MKLPKLPGTFGWVFAFAMSFAVHGAASTGEAREHCPGYVAGEKTPYWGDLHVHTGYSLDAYGYGTVASPAEAYRFAKGEAISLPDGSSAKLPRPLDFTAVTDHAEWLDLMYICTDPEYADYSYCKLMREKSSPTTGREVFANYVVPTITREQPQKTPICEQHPDRCDTALNSQWQRTQQQANEADDPCNFTAFIAFEWSATQAFAHTHRNVIFANTHVTDQPIDYIRYPELEEFWRQLDQRCRADEGCDAIAIPHNNNMADGRGFDVETEQDRALALRSRFERLVEVHQEKGNSECLSPLESQDENDCAFEVRLTSHSKLKDRSDFDAAEWETMRRGYVRGLLLRGLEAYKNSGESRQNPLQLGIVGSTDNHTATPGNVVEDEWSGSAFGLGNLKRAMSLMDWNPGGLVAVRAEENTRESLFAAMKRREVYATSGPRIVLNFEASADSQGLSCEDTSKTPATAVPMGGAFSKPDLSPTFRIQAWQDRVPLEKVEIVKGELRDGKTHESVLDITPQAGIGKGSCITWKDPDFQAAAPAFWYVRISQTPTLRWSARMCREEGRCQEFPGADQTIRERAWSSPIWYAP